MFNNLISQIFGNTSPSRKPTKQKGRHLQLEFLEARELLSVNPILPFQSDQIATAQEAPLQVEEAETTTLSGLTLKVTAANYAALNAQYDFANVTELVDVNLTADGVTLVFQNCTVTEDLNLYAKNGGVIRFPNLVTHKQNQSNEEWYATGANSRIEMTALETVVHLKGSYVDARAASGGVVDLSKLLSTDYLYVNSTGANSNVDISSFVNLKSNVSKTNITTASGGTVTVHNNITKLDNVILSLANPSDLVNFDATKITSIVASSITLNGGTLDFSNCTRIDATNIYAKGGGVIKFPKVTAVTWLSGNPAWDATGANSRIELSALETITCTYTTPSSYYINISAASGGVIDLSKLSSVNRLVVSSTGSGSNVDISSLVNLKSTAAKTNISTTSSGTVTVHNNITKLDNVILSLANPSNLVNFDSSKITSISNSTLTFTENYDLSKVTSITNSTLTLTGGVFDVSSVTSISGSTITANGVTLNFSSCTEMVNTSLYAKNGGVMKFPKLTNYITTSDSHWDLSVTGTGSQLDFSALTTIQNRDASNSWDNLDITASTGGKINLSQVKWVNYARLTSQGFGSEIDISTLPTLGASGRMSVAISGDSIIKLGTNITKLENVTLSGITGLINFNSSKITSIYLSNLSLSGVIFDARQITKIDGSSITADGVTLDFSACTEMVNTSLYAKNGGVMKFPKLTNYITTSDSHWDLSVTGTGSQLDFSALTTIQNRDASNSWDNLDITASTGGKINLSQVKWINYARLTSKNAGSVVYLSDMISISGSMNTTTDDGGVVIIGKDYNSTPGANAGQGDNPENFSSVLADTPGKSNGGRAAFSSETGETTLEWASFGSNYRYLVYKDAQLVVNLGTETSYIDETPGATNTYSVYAYNDTLKKWSWVTPIVVTATAPKIEITGHEILPNGNIKLNWNNVGTNYMVYQSGFPASGSSYLKTTDWTDTKPLADNQYQIYASYTDTDGRTKWTWSNIYFVTKPAAAPAASSLDAFWAEYDNSVVDDDVLNGIVY